MATTNGFRGIQWAARVRAAGLHLTLSCRYGPVMLVLDREAHTVIDWMN